MNVLLFFIATLIAGALTGLAYGLASHGLLATRAGLLGFWLTDGLFERSFGYQRSARRAGFDNLSAHWRDSQASE